MLKDFIDDKPNTINDSRMNYTLLELSEVISLRYWDNSVPDLHERSFIFSITHDNIRCISKSKKYCALIIKSGIHIEKCTSRYKK